MIGVDATLLESGAHEQIGDGWIYAIDPSVDALEELLRLAHETGAVGIGYLVGDAQVLPLPDASVDACIVRAADDTAADELYRVLRPGGRLAAAESDGDAFAGALRAAGFEDVELRDADAPPAWLEARKPAA